MKAERKNSVASPVSHYSMDIRWSEEDRVFMVILPEFDNAMTHGATYKEAVKQGADLIESCIMWYRQDGKPLPNPAIFDYEKTVAARTPELAIAH